MRRKKRRRLTRIRWLHTAVRIPRSDHERLIAAASRLEISVSEFLRLAVREKADRALEEKLSA
jgi:hypothetical protein